MRDDSPEHFISELVRTGARRAAGASRDTFIVLENHRNTASLLGPAGAPTTADAQWNDDFHHCLHVILTGETDGYYADYRATSRMRSWRACSRKAFATRAMPRCARAGGAAASRARTCRRRRS